MANPIIELDPVTHITAGAIGKPGQRTFFIQAEKGLERVTLVCEKEQVVALADAVDEMVVNLEQEFGLARHEDLKVDDDAMHVKEPAEPLFRVGAMGLGYDANRDKILLVAQEAMGEEGEQDEEREPREVRFFATRAQMQVVSQYAREVVGRGRNPDQVVMQSEVHFRRNGHGDH
jgi:uncharacterized repeat protein (TIGR03847 family)